MGGAEVQRVELRPLRLRDSGFIHELTDSTTSGMAASRTTRAAVVGRRTVVRHRGRRTRLRLPRGLALRSPRRGAVRAARAGQRVAGRHRGGARVSVPASPVVQDAAHRRSRVPGRESDPRIRSSPGHGPAIEPSQRQDAGHVEGPNFGSHPRSQRDGRPPSAHETHRLHAHALGARARATRAARLGRVRARQLATRRRARETANAPRRGDPALREAGEPHA